MAKKKAFPAFAFFAVRSWPPLGGMRAGRGRPDGGAGSKFTLRKSSTSAISRQGAAVTGVPGALPPQRRPPVSPPAWARTYLLVALKAPRALPPPCRPPLKRPAAGYKEPLTAAGLQDDGRL